jgi:hypothetical protein
MVTATRPILRKKHVVVKSITPKPQQAPTGEEIVEVSKLPIDMPHPFLVLSDFKGVRVLGFRVKCVLVGSAFGADPVIRKIVERCTRFYTAVGVSGRRIVHVTAYFTDILLHALLLCIMV